MWLLCNTVFGGDVFLVLAGLVSKLFSRARAGWLLV